MPFVRYGTNLRVITKATREMKMRGRKQTRLASKDDDAPFPMVQSMRSVWSWKIMATIPWRPTLLMTAACELKASGYSFSFLNQSTKDDAYDPLKKKAHQKLKEKSSIREALSFESGKRGLMAIKSPRKKINPMVP